MLFSIISPVYRAENTLNLLVEQIEQSISPITSDYEIILVEDCGPDNSRELIRQICASKSHVKGVFLSRNFGQQYALNAGFDVASGQWIVTLDCDLQDNPSFIQTMYKRALEGYDIVFASRQSRQDSYLKKTGSKWFNKCLSFLTGTEQDDSIANYVLYNHKVIEAMKSLGDYRRYYPLMNHWVGFRRFVEPIPHNERPDGIESSYTFSKRLKLALNTMVAFSDRPLTLILELGIGIAAISVILAIALATHYLFTGITVSGWLTLFVSIWFVFGIQIALLGLVGIYVGKIYEQSKNRPSYIVSEKINL